VHIVWFILMVGSFMTLVSNNVRVAIKMHENPSYYKSGRNTGEITATFIWHIINYIVFYFALTNFIEHYT
jgi:hypothetical protein